MPSEILQARAPGHAAPDLFERADDPLFPALEGFGVTGIDAGEEIEGEGVPRVLQIEQHDVLLPARRDAAQDVHDEVSVRIEHAQTELVEEVLDDEVEQEIGLASPLLADQVEPGHAAPQAQPDGLVARQVAADEGGGRGRGFRLGND